MNFQRTDFKPVPGVFDQEGLDYLGSRYLSFTEARQMRISAIGGYVHFPYIVDGEILRWKSRSMHNKKVQFWSPLPEGTKWEAPFFNQASTAPGQYLIITEGEFDCLALSEIGAVNVVSLPNGASAVEGTLKQNFRFLQNFDRIYIAFDDDEAGNIAAKKAMQIIPPGKYYRIKFPMSIDESLPIKDANDWVIANNPNQADLIKLISSAYKPHSEKIKHLSQVDDGFFDALDIGVSSGWEHLDYILGGIRKGEVIVVTAETGCGKTTWCVNLAVNLVNRGKNVWINSYEMNPKTIHRKIASIVLEKNLKIRAFTEKEKNEYKEWAAPKGLHINQGNEGSDIDTLRADIEIASLAYGIEYVIVDHLDYIQSPKAKNVTESIDDCMRKLHSIAMEFNVGIILVAHIKQVQGAIRAITLNDLKGSASIKQYPDAIIILHRMDVLDISQKNKVQLSVVKNRLLGKQFTINLNYNPVSDSFTQTPAGY